MSQIIIKFKIKFSQNGMKASLISVKNDDLKASSQNTLCFIHKLALKYFWSPHPYHIHARIYDKTDAIQCCLNQ